jgi:hypothetical protein
MCRLLNLGWQNLGVTPLYGLALGFNSCICYDWIHVKHDISCLSCLGVNLMYINHR